MKKTKQSNFTYEIEKRWPLRIWSKVVEQLKNGQNNLTKCYNLTKKFLSNYEN